MAAHRTGVRAPYLVHHDQIVRLCTGVYRLLKTAKSTRSTRTPAAMNRM